MPLSFRGRILGILILLGAVPTTVLIVGWVISLRTAGPAGSARAALEEMGTSGRALVEAIDTTRLSTTERTDLRTQVEALNESLARAQRSLVYLQYYSAGLAIAILALGAILVYASVNFAGHLSRQLSRPIDELVGWTKQIREGRPLPAGPLTKGAPEFESLRNALRRMATELELGRKRELEAERLRAFREVARRVAHEMKNPLTPIRFAVAQLGATGDPEQEEALEVLQAETTRLEHLAREFTEFGRLPQGPAADVDLNELLTELTRTLLPSSVHVTLDLQAAPAIVEGHYDPLRRAFGNVLQNAVEATGGTGNVRVVSRARDDAVVVEIADDGVGILPADRDRVFDPYVTGKTEGTGLGLALVRQAIEQHGGTVTIEDNSPRGARFILSIPVRPEGAERSPESAARLS